MAKKKKDDANHHGKVLVGFSILFILIACVLLVFWYQKHVAEG